MARRLTPHEQQVLRERGEALARMREEHGRCLRALERLVEAPAPDPESLLRAIRPSPMPEPSLVAGAVHAVVDVLSAAPFGGTWELDTDPDSKTFGRPVIFYENNVRHDPAALALAVAIGEVPWDELRPVLLAESAA